MIPLIMASEGDMVTITKVKGNEEVKRHIENLGFVPGAEVKVITKQNGNLILNIKESRIAINGDTAKRIMF